VLLNWALRWRTLMARARHEAGSPLLMRTGTPGGTIQPVKHTTYSDTCDLDVVNGNFSRVVMQR
jgi:hypothetical protein